MFYIIPCKSKESPIDSKTMKYLSNKHIVIQGELFDVTRLNQETENKRNQTNDKEGKREGEKKKTQNTTNLNNLNNTIDICDVKFYNEENEEIKGEFYYLKSPVEEEPSVLRGIKLTQTGHRIFK